MMIVTSDAIDGLISFSKNKILNLKKETKYRYSQIYKKILSIILYLKLLLFSKKNF